MELLFGKGDTDFSFWVFTVRLNILVFVAASLVVLVSSTFALRTSTLLRARPPLVLAVLLTLAAAAVRFAIPSNLSEMGGIGYSRILTGYTGHFGAAQLYSLIYQRTARDLEHAIFLNRIVSTLTVPLVYVLGRCLRPGSRSFAAIAAGLVALHPLLILFAATEALPNCTLFLAAASYVLVAVAADDRPRAAWLRALTAIAAAAGLALLTQIRYENVLFFIPVAVFLGVRRGSQSRGALLPAAALLSGLLILYGVQTVTVGASYHGGGQFFPALRASLGEVVGLPIFAVAPLAAGTLAAMVLDRRVRWYAPLPLFCAIPLSALASPLGHHVARTFVTHVLLAVLVAAHGLALLLEHPSTQLRLRPARLASLACLTWFASLPLACRGALWMRHIEIAEHDFFRRAVAALPAGVDRIIVPDDELMRRESHSTIEVMSKYRMILAAATDSGGDRKHVGLTGITAFLEHRSNTDCSRGRCLFFRGLPCLDLPVYRRTDGDGVPGQCAALAASGIDQNAPPISEEDIVAGSFLDCSLRPERALPERCPPSVKPQRFGLYPVDAR